MLGFIENFKKKALKLLEEEKVSDLFFSRGTYQLKVIESNKEYWPLLQIDDQGN